MAVLLEPPFFMDLNIIQPEEIVRDNISLNSLKDKPKEKRPEIKAEKIELSKNIQKFDKKPKVYTENPYAYNYISLKKDKPNASPSATAEQMITNPTYNTIGKFLGIDTIHDWNKYYDKVFTITEWAKKKSGTDNTGNLMRWISSKARTVPSMGGKNIDNLYLFARLALNKNG